MTIPLGTLEWEEGIDLEAKTVSLKGRLSKIRRGYEFEATLAGGLTLECVRCLQPFTLALGFDFHLLFVSGDDRPRSGEAQVQEADFDLYACPDGKADLAAVAREQIYLHIPLKPVCHDSCRGLCRVCGENLNRGPCRCAEPVYVRVV